MGRAKIGYKYIASVTGYSKKEIKEIYTRFSTYVDKDSEGLPLPQFLKLPEIVDFPFPRQLFECFERSGDKVVDFFEYVSVLALLSGRGRAEQRMSMLFHLFDEDHDGSITFDEFVRLHSALRGLRDGREYAAPRSALREELRAPFAVADADGNGVIDRDEFCRVFSDGALGGYFDLAVLHLDGRRANPLYAPPARAAPN